MSDIEGLSHSPPPRQDEAQALAAGIPITPQLRLGAPVLLTTSDGTFRGFVLSIDRTGVESDVMVLWNTVPVWAKGSSYGHFKASQIRWDGASIWVATP